MRAWNKKLFLIGLTSVLGPVAIYFCTRFLLDYWKTDNQNSSKQVENPNFSSVSGQTIKITIIYGGVTGTSYGFAQALAAKLKGCMNCIVSTVDVVSYDDERLEREDVVLFICSTWTDGIAPPNAVRFVTWLKDTAYDFRVSKNHLAKMRFSVFGLGAAIYGDNYGKTAIEVHECFVELGAKQIVPLSIGDDASDLEIKFEKWSNDVVKWVNEVEYHEDSQSQTAHVMPVETTASKQTANQMAYVRKTKNGKARTPKTAEEIEFQIAQKQKHIDAVNAARMQAHTSSSGHNTTAPLESTGDTAAVVMMMAPAEDEDDEEEEEDIINKQFIMMDSDSEDEGACGTGEEDAVDNDHDNDDGEGLLDVEDLGSMINQSKAQNKAGVAPEEAREMVTKLQRKALTKEGYRIIGTHSAVKLCRWTKNQMRGRGGCYKHTFYGITSYQCMEATPSLACANKCVFCWRHHKNPVGTEWRWKTDEPDRIVQEAIELHRGMINEMKGVPGVLPERLLEANTVKHCALSLVGEPIMYPRINEMIRELHDRDISSFMVTNAQFPECIKSLEPVTQLYVSVDAATRDSLKAVDRPLFKDFWERFMASLKEMKAKKQRTVYRLTLVKSWNMNEIEDYVTLLESGQPDFIEIKAVTYCGKSDASTLTMQNVPWHQEVCTFSEAIARRLAERGHSVPYSIATEHEHSCCILLAREDKFKVNGVWHTWIDYPKFHELMNAYYASGGTALFESTDYMAETPEWALYSSVARGFDPEEQRWRKNKSGAIVEVKYKPSGSGCG